MARPARDPFAEEPIEGQTTVEEQVAESDGMDEFKPVVVGTGRNANQRYAAAQKVLRERHLDEFQDLLREEYRADGLDYKVRLTAEERAALEREEKRAKAQAQIDALRAEFPDLD